MSEENLNQNAAEVPAAEPVAEASSAPVEAVAAPEASEATAPAVEPAVEPAAEPSVTQPQVIIQRERGFSHYVGFALLAVLCICFFFMPGIAVTFAVSLLVDLSGAAAWIFSAILSVIVWLIFKLKIKGFKKSFLWYIALCVVVLAILIAIQVGLDYNIFSKLIALLTGAAG